MGKNSVKDEAEMKKAIETLEPIDVNVAERILKELKQILDGLGITFFLRKGTCLGAIRDNKIIPWDDDLDIGSEYGYKGLTEKAIDRVITALKNNGYLVKVHHQDYVINVVVSKSSIRTDWMVHRVIDGSTFHWPGVRMPTRLFTDTKEIDFIGEKFQVPNPVEDYLRFMYGSDWKTPKKAGYYEKDVLDQIPNDSLPGHAGKLKQFIINHLMPWRASIIKVLDSDGKPVSEAEVTITGLGPAITNRRGYAKFYIPYDYIYSLVIRYDGHEEVLYQEHISPRKKYIYKADSLVTSGRNFIIIPED